MWSPDLMIWHLIDYFIGGHASKGILIIQRFDSTKIFEIDSESILTQFCLWIPVA